MHKNTENTNSKSSFPKYLKTKASFLKKDKLYNTLFIFILIPCLLNQLKKLLWEMCYDGKKNSELLWLAIDRSFSSKSPKKWWQTTPVKMKKDDLTWQDDLGELPMKGPNFLNTLTKPVRRSRNCLVTCHSFSTDKQSCISRFQLESNSLRYMSSKSL